MKRLKLTGQPTELLPGAGLISTGPTQGSHPFTGNPGKTARALCSSPISADGYLTLLSKRQSSER